MIIDAVLIISILAMSGVFLSAVAYLTLVVAGEPT